MQTASIAIPKEQVGDFAFYNTDVFDCSLEKARRNYQLQRAMSLGNLYQHKVNIEYKLDTGERHKVYTTVWTICPDYVILKGGRGIPIKAITNIRLI